MTGISTTAEELFKRISIIILKFAAFWISLVVSDSAGNVKKLRELICTEWPWILNCPDPCHLLNLLSKDLMVRSKKHPKVKGFADVMTIVSAITTYFSHSNFSQFHLQKELESEPDKHGIQAAGATRFSTFSINVKSILRCYAPMQRCYEKGKLTFAGKGSKTIEKCLKDGPEMYTFKTQLHHVTSILSPIERGLQTLEGQNMTISDVLSIFIGIAITFTRVFQNPNTEIFQYRDESFAAFDRRFQKLLDSSTKDMFWLGFLLDPSKQSLFWVFSSHSFQFIIVMVPFGLICCQVNPSPKKQSHHSCSSL
ncbi:ribonuclease H-like domain-containing protein [Mycena floridula]|nr:ribonuclease H-like domain-containing protein [Mycena floridula]